MLNKLVYFDCNANIQFFIGTLFLQDLNKGCLKDALEKNFTTAVRQLVALELH